MDTEKAYAILANVLFAHTQDNEKFDKLEMIIEVDEGFLKNEVTRHLDDKEFYPRLDMISPQAENDLTVASQFLRGNLLETTGDKIWGFTFTLYPDGQFNIDYTYDMPEWMQDD
ncbi:hypothetical protein J8L98_13695 [Pseudoalteromonas sp. MMG013]|uniref:hypothetical protein n=1 Tax=Pseudoalteromonas sp. MMG013 TaxID=2822687 RepID=UPI001B371FC2|nr:hypothetical protein [Pseudoalteromonas sp. MMG013]MBQ4862745.1 hypothetical protein [Pseudoalteromonas sp. MMG013]